MPSPSPGENNRISKLRGRPARLFSSRQQHRDCILVAGVQMEMGARGRQSLMQLVSLGPLSAPVRGRSVFGTWEGICNSTGACGHRPWLAEMGVEFGIQGERCLMENV